MSEACIELKIVLFLLFTMSRNRWHAPYTCMPQVNGRLATIYKALVKAKERSQKRKREGKRKAENGRGRRREREGERVPRNYTRVSYDGTSTGGYNNRPKRLRVVSSIDDSV